MSLKAIHLLFITLAATLSAGFGVWCLQSHLAANNPMYLAMGVVSFAAAGGLVFYGAWFIKKLKRQGLL